MNDDEALALAKRIAKHQAPAQVKVDPEEAKRQLVRLALEKLLDADNATADDVNRFLYFRGLRPCPHSHHSTEEEFAACIETVSN